MRGSVDPRRTALAAVGALLVNATVWGLSWIPFRALDGLGVHSLWTTTWIYALSTAAVIACYPRALARLLGSRWLLLLALAAGLTNACFNWGVTVGEVVRVVLLFYLMPVWAAVFARLLLGERTGAGAAVRIALAIGGAFVVLWQSDGLPGLPSSLADWLGVAGGAAFALTNVLLRKQAADPPEARALAMFAGGLAVPGALALALSWAAAGAPLADAPRAAADLLSAAAHSRVAWPATGTTIALIATATAAVFLASNLALQYGAARLPSNVTAVVMLAEVVVAAVSSALLGNEPLTARTLAGGAMIIAASLLAAFAQPGLSRRRSGGADPAPAPRPPGRA
ncbi:MAG TPA: DMT family transporter [Burkholderiaceae bacterium]